MNKIMTSYEKCIKNNFVVPLKTGEGKTLKIDNMNINVTRKSSSLSKNSRTNHGEKHVGVPLLLPQ